MAAQSHYGTPVSTYVDEHGVTYVGFNDDNGRARVGLLRRPDLMKLASAIARDGGMVGIAGVKNSNEELLQVVIDGSPWTRRLDDPAPRRKRVPNRVPREESPNEERISPERHGALVTVTCACGHGYRYHVKGTGARRDSTIAWLESKPCPTCSKNGQPEQDNNNKGPDGTPDAPLDRGGEVPNDQDIPELDDDAPMREEKDHEDAPPKPEKKAKAKTPAPVDLDALADVLVSKIQERMSPVKMPVLHHETLEKVIKLMQARGGNGQRLNLWLQGPPGTGKSTIVEQAAAALDMDFHAVSCTETMPESKLMGFVDANGTEHRTPFMDAYENGGVFLLDELDSGNSNLIGGLNSAISNGHCSFAGRTITRHADNFIFGTANTAGAGPEAGFLGNNGVSKATLDRFTMVYVGIDENQETSIVETILPADTAGSLLSAVRHIRRATVERGLHILVSPRTSYDAAIMIRAGFSVEDALKAKCLFGLDAMTTDSLLGGI